jgi:hypothetical protein
MPGIRCRDAPESPRLNLTTNRAPCRNGFSSQAGTLSDRPCLEQMLRTWRRNPVRDGVRDAVKCCCSGARTAPEYRRIAKGWQARRPAREASRRETDLDTVNGGENGQRTAGTGPTSGLGPAEAEGKSLAGRRPAGRKAVWLQPQFLRRLAKPRCGHKYRPWGWAAAKIAVAVATCRRGGRQEPSDACARMADTAGAAASAG